MKQHVIVAIGEIRIGKELRDVSTSMAFLLYGTAVLAVFLLLCSFCANWCWHVTGILQNYMATGELAEAGRLGLALPE